MANDTQRTIFLIEKHESARASLLNGLTRAVRSVMRLFLAGRLPKDDAKQRVVELVDTTRRNLAELKWAQLDNLSEDRVQGEPVVEPWDDGEELVAKLIEGDLSEEELRAEVEEAVHEVEQEATEEHGGSSSQVIGYRRVPHPELSEGGTCGLCVLASDQVYKKGNLKNLHPGCRCTVVEITTTNDPGGALNNLELGELYSMIGGTDGHEAHKVRFKRDADGNLVRYEDPKQRLPENDPDEVGRRRRAERSPEDNSRRIEVLEREIAKYERRQARGEDVAEELKALRDRLARLRAA